MYQKILILGNLGRDAEVHRSGEKHSTRFSLASNESYTDRDGNPKKETTWYQVRVSGKQGESCARLKKGSLVLVEGHCAVEAYKGKDGTPKATLVVYARTVKWGDVKLQEEEAAEEKVERETSDDTIPF